MNIFASISYSFFFFPFCLSWFLCLFAVPKIYIYLHFLHSACWSAIYLYFINSKGKNTSTNQPDALYSLYSYRLQLSVCYSFVHCDVSIVVQRITMQMTDMTENWIINRKRMALLVHLLKPFAYSLHAICCCWA